VPDAGHGRTILHDLAKDRGRQLAICLLQCHRKHHGCIEHEGSHVGDRATADLPPQRPDLGVAQIDAAPCRSLAQRDQTSHR